MKASQALVVLASLAVGSVASAQKALRLNLSPGKTYTYAMAMNSPQGMVGPMSQSLDLSMKVLKKVGDVYHVEMRVANTKVNLPKSTADPKAAEQAKKAAAATKFLATFNSRGAMLSMKVAGGSPALAGAMSGLNFGFMGMEFPAAPVKVGSSWTMKHDIKKIIGKSLGPMASQMNMKGGPLVVKYTVKKIAGNLVTIESNYSGDLELTMKQGKQNEPMKMTISGAGTANVDSMTGLQRQTTMNVTSSITSPMKTSQKIAMTFTLK